MGQVDKDQASVFRLFFEKRYSEFQPALCLKPDPFQDPGMFLLLVLRVFVSFKECRYLGMKNLVGNG